MNTRAQKRRKMTEPYGDSNHFEKPEEDIKPSDAKNACVSSQAASGDTSLSNSSHEEELIKPSKHSYFAIVTDSEKEEKDLIVHSQCCDTCLWSYRYPMIINDYTKRKSIHTGNLSYDSFLPELSHFGYNPLQLLTKGRSGAIILAQDLTQGQFSKLCCDIKSPVAIKLFSRRKKKSKETHDEDSIQQELSIHRSISHPNIVTMLNHVSSSEKVGLVLEFCYCGNLDQLLRTRNARFFSEPIARRYFKQVLSAVEYLFCIGISHRDICTTNILLTNDNTAKLADFGCAVRFMTGDDLRTDICGTVGYQAPEIICGKPYNPKTSDIFSLGCLLYCMVVGHLPYGKYRTAAIALHFKAVQFPKKEIHSVSQDIQEILRGMLAYIPCSRYSLNCIKHSAWMQTQVHRVQIGNFYLVRQPQKVYEGKREKELKFSYEI